MLTVKYGLINPLIRVMNALISVRVMFSTASNVFVGLSGTLVSSWLAGQNQSMWSNESLYLDNIISYHATTNTKTYYKALAL